MALRSMYVIVIITSAFLLNGCATSRDFISLSIPASGNVSASNGRQIYIRSVVDKRRFEVDPRSPNIPSLDPSEAENDNIKRRAIARKRGGFGKAFGDILLKEGQTVESVISESLRQAFTEEGYTVVAGSSDLSKKDLQVVDVEINKFWSWMNPGFWAITLSTEIGTDIIVQASVGGEKKSVYVKAADHFQTGVEGNWLDVMHTALRDYINEVKAKIK